MNSRSAASLVIPTHRRQKSSASPLVFTGRRRGCFILNDKCSSKQQDSSLSKHKALAFGLPIKMRTPFVGDPTFPSSYIHLQSIFRGIKNSKDTLIGPDAFIFKDDIESLQKTLSNDLKNVDFNDAILNLLYKIEMINCQVPVVTLTKYDLYSDNGVKYRNYASQDSIAIHKLFNVALYMGSMTFHQCKIDKITVKKFIHCLNTSDPSLQGVIEDVIASIYNICPHFQEYILIKVMRNFDLIEESFISPLYVRAGLRLYFTFLRSTSELSDKVIQAGINHIEPLLTSRFIPEVSKNLEPVMLYVAGKRTDVADRIFIRTITRWPRTDSRHTVSLIRIISQLGPHISEEILEKQHARFYYIMCECLRSLNAKIVTAALGAICTEGFMSVFRFPKKETLQNVTSVLCSWSDDVKTVKQETIAFLDKYESNDIIETPKSGLTWDDIRAMASH